MHAMRERRLGGFMVGSVAAEPISLEDFEDLCEMHSNPVVMQTLGGIRDREETDRFLKRNLAHWQQHGFGLWCLRDGDDGRFIGRAGLRWVRIEGTDEVEVAYALRADAWGRGLATAICEQLVTTAADADVADDLIAFTLSVNQRSRRVMQKAGFAYEREFEHAGEPHVLYRRQLRPAR